MPTFVLAYRNRPGYTPTPQTQAAWHAWFGSMGDQLADMGKPVIAEAALGNCSRESTEMGGYSLIEADDLEEPLRALGRRSAEGRSTPGDAMQADPPPVVTLYELLEENVYRDLS